MLQGEVDTRHTSFQGLIGEGTKRNPLSAVWEPSNSEPMGSREANAKAAKAKEKAKEAVEAAKAKAAEQVRASRP